jgi:LysM repeat protein
MKSTSKFLLCFALSAAPAAFSQDAATEERLNKLTGQIEDLIAVQKTLNDRISALSKEIINLHEQASKPAGNYAAQEDLKRLADSVREVDRKRTEDYEKISAQILKLGKVVATPSQNSKRSSTSSSADVPRTEKSEPAQKGFDYTIEKNDTLSVIVQAYREKNIKVTTEQILKANPGLNPNRLRPGQKIFIPAPANSRAEVAGRNSNAE